MKKFIMVVVLVLASCTVVHAGTLVSFGFINHSSFISVQHSTYRVHNRMRNNVRYVRMVVHQPVHDCYTGRGYSPVVHRQEGRTYYTNDYNVNVIVVPSNNGYCYRST